MSQNTLSQAVEDAMELTRACLERAFPMDNLEVAQSHQGDEDDVCVSIANTFFLVPRYVEIECIGDRTARVIKWVIGAIDYTPATREEPEYHEYFEATEPLILGDAMVRLGEFLIAFPIEAELEARAEMQMDQDAEEFWSEMERNEQ